MSTISSLQNTKQTTLWVSFYIKPTHIEKWKAAHRPVWTACSREPKCILFDVFQDPLQPGHFRLLEVWDANREWFEKEQLTKSYYQELWVNSKPTWEKEMEIEWFERLGEGCSYKKAYLEGGSCVD